MIKNQWYVILESKEVKSKPIGVTRFNKKLVLWRDAEGNLKCIVDKCIHRGASLCKGHIVNGNIECPFHGFQYDGSGKCTLIPANGKNSPISAQFVAEHYAVKEEHGFIWVFYGDYELEKGEIPFFKDIDDTYTYDTITDHWSVDYSRVIENQLDVVHVPFIHKTTIGRGNKTLINGPVTTIDKDNTITVKVFNSLDLGEAPKKAEELVNAEREQKLVFKYPNLWQNYINEKIRVIIAFVPIDDENTKLYLRFYQNITRVPVLRHVFNKIGSLANYIIENQDKRIVITQEPKKSGLAIGEKLIAGDFPVVQYRKIREELQNRR